MPTCPLRKIKKKAKLNPKKKKPRQMPSTTRKSPSSIAFHAKLPKSPKLDHDPEMTATQNLNSTKKHLAWPDIAEKDVATTTTVEVTTIVEAIEVVDIVAAAIINIAVKEVEESTAVTVEVDSTTMEVIKLLCQNWMTRLFAGRTYFFESAPEKLFWALTLPKFL